MKTPGRSLLTDRVLPTGVVTVPFDTGRVIVDTETVGRTDVWRPRERDAMPDGPRVDAGRGAQRRCSGVTRTVVLATNG
jgi:hypothetical protein